MTQENARICSGTETTFDEWREAQDFEYHRTASEVVDYVNENIDYETLDQLIENGETETIDWDNLYDTFDISPDSDEANAAKTHIEGYIGAKSN